MSNQRANQSNQQNKQTGGFKKSLVVFAVMVIIGLLAALAWLILPTNSLSQTTQTPQIDQHTTSLPAQPIQDNAAKQYAPSDQTQASVQTALPPSQQTNTVQQVNTAEHVPTDKINPNTGLPYHKNDPAILQKRREVMTQLADIIDKTSKGRKADAQTLQNLVTEIKNIEKQGYLSTEDTNNTLAFIQKAYPDLDIVK